VELEEEGGKEKVKIPSVVLQIHRGRSDDKALRAVYALELGAGVR
jgi:hypothetical protein